MILVTVGTHSTMHFNRLLIPMDELAAELDEQVIIQRGCSSYQPKYAESFQFTTSEHIEELTRNARIIVSHAGAGTIILALREKKPLVVVPRLKHADEVIDDHQLELAAALDEQQRAVAVYEPSIATLRDAIDCAARQQKQGGGSMRLIQALQRQFKEWNLGEARFTDAVERKT